MIILTVTDLKLQIAVVNMIIITYMGEITGQLAFVAAIPQIWCIPFLVWLRTVDTTTVSKWTIWGVMTVFLGSPYGEFPEKMEKLLLEDECFLTSGSNITAHPIQVGWASRNSNTVRSRTVGAAVYNMCVQAYVTSKSNFLPFCTGRQAYQIPSDPSRPWSFRGSIIASNVYQSTDNAPRYPRGNTALLCIAVINIVLYAATKVYYAARNHARERRWRVMGEEERRDYLRATKDGGNKRLDFRFTS